MLSWGPHTEVTKWSAICQAWCSLLSIINSLILHNNFGGIVVADDHTKLSHKFNLLMKTQFYKTDGFLIHSLKTFSAAHILLVFEKLHSIKHVVPLFGWKLLFSMALLLNSFSFTLDFSSVFLNFPELWNNLIPSSVGMRHFLTEQDLIYNLKKKGKKITYYSYQPSGVAQW